MPQIEHLFDPPDRFVAGTVGAPGQRTFFLQARQGVHLISVALEKQQVEILGERVLELIEEVRQSGTGGELPVFTEDLIDSAALDQPIDEEFRAGTITLSWDASDRRVVVEVYSVDGAPDTPIETDEETLQSIEFVEPEADEVLIVRLLPAQAMAFSSRAASVVSAGRPQCQFCGGPIDPEGHLCPRANGFRRRA
ncbi:MAG: DUF3090 domain-containing protein [Myxococcales bacterium]|nr:MAG: DUF3090 domain-containing protein [Myxococcales bacterium]